MGTLFPLFGGVCRVGLVTIITIGPTHYQRERERERDP